MSKETTVVFEPSGRKVSVLPDTLILEAAARAGFMVQTPCGGAGSCGKCRVQVTEGTCPPSAQAQQVLGDEAVADGFRLACQCQISENVTIVIPSSSLFQSGDKILANGSSEEVDIKPRITRQKVHLVLPERDDVHAYAARLLEEIDGASIEPRALRSLGSLVSPAGVDLEVTSIDRRIIQVDRPSEDRPCLGVAFDIGTTTLVCTLVDLASGRDLAMASRVNPQTAYGDDVLSRINKCREQDDGLAVLHDAILGAVCDLINEVVSEADVAHDDVYEVVFAANSTMLHLLANVDPSPLGELPFMPVFRDAVRLPVTDLPLPINPGGDAWLFPQIGGFVGGDTVAGILATRLEQLGEPALLLDVGTNGELVLAVEGQLIATSVAAGPAFEGARIKRGMRATSGAIEKVVFNDDVHLNVIGHAKPIGLCGTGLIDTVAGLLDKGILDETGRLLDPDELPGDLSDALKKRLSTEDDQPAFVLAWASEAANGEDLRLTQKDIRELQLANGAIRAGINILLRRQGLSADDLGAIYLAGAFGNFIRRRHARRIGMIPQLPTEKIRFVGNTASFGAKRFLLSVEEKEAARRIMENTKHIDLSLDAEFQMEFGAAMMFPEA